MKFALILRLIFAKKYMLITGDDQLIETNYPPNEIATSGNALYFKTTGKV